jgi:hypothetical protein
MNAVFPPPDVFMSRWEIESWIIKWIYNLTCHVGEEHKKSAKLSWYPTSNDKTSRVMVAPSSFHFISQKVHWPLLDKLWPPCKMWFLCHVCIGLHGHYIFCPCEELSKVANLGNKNVLAVRFILKNIKLKLKGKKHRPYKISYQCWRTTRLHRHERNHCKFPWGKHHWTFERISEQNLREN